MMMKVQAITKNGEIVMCEKYLKNGYCYDHIDHKQETDSQEYFNELAQKTKELFND